ncbi:MAG: DNA translocase FtsK [Treponema sp.]|jgi:S-DNA-T family DNA segregation ATPase FtsK/SpoIIIE|nr:DNA translocase FtsK [Treponema sp.]
MKAQITIRIERYRCYCIIAAVLIGLAGLLLGASVIAALTGARGLGAAPGAFLARSYGILALAVPAYLVAAALLLIARGFRADRLFLLCCSAVPFFTLAVGYSWVRNIDLIALEHPFFGSTGRLGTAFIFINIVLAEVLLIILLKQIFFPSKPVRPAKERLLPSPSPLGGLARETPAEDLGGVFLALIPPPPQKALPWEGTFIALPPPPANADAASGLEDDADAEALREEAAGLIEMGLDDDEDSDAADDPRSLIKRALSRLRELEASAEQFSENADIGAVRDNGDNDGNVNIDDNNDNNDTCDISDNDDNDDIDDNSDTDDIRDIDNNSDISDNNDIDDIGDTINIENTDDTGDIDTDDDVETALARAEEEAQKHKPFVPTGKRGASPYAVPIGGILNQYPDGQYWVIDDATRQAALVLKETLREFKIQAEVTGIRKGPVITMFEILPAPGVKLSKIVNLQDNIALRLAASSVRIVAPIPGKHAVGIEVPNPRRSIVSFREIIEGELGREGKPLEVPVVLGKDITGGAVTVDLVSMPHLLIAGSTGSGKSVCVNTMILSILYQRPPAECRLILIDPKIVELKLYNGIPHLLTPVITEPKRAFQALQYCIFEMERRYSCLDSMGVRDIKSYNRKVREKGIAAEHIPYIIVVIDEFADLMATTGKELESTVARLAAMSRAVGIHLVLATQRPSIDVITGLIKANIPSRIAFMVASKMDSRIIIDMVGAEKLLGKGDMLYAGVTDPFPIRLQGAFVSEEEVERVVDCVKTLGEPDYIDDEMFYDDDDDDGDDMPFQEGDDPLYDKALEIVVQQGKASASYIQRRLKIGYNRAARLVEEMEHRGVVGPAQGSKPRDLLRGV